MSTVVRLRDRRHADPVSSRVSPSPAPSSGASTSPGSPSPAFEIRREPAIPDWVLRQQEDDVVARDATPVGSTILRPGRSVRSARSTVQRLLLAGVVLCGLLVVYYLISLFQVWSVGRSDQARPVDAIVVLGAAQYDGRPSPQLAARLDHVVVLWNDGIAPAVVVTGGKQPGDRFTEAEASANYLIERGVPDAAIIRENDGSTTFESLDTVADLLDGAGLAGVDDRSPSVVIVTDPYHALRSRMTAQDVGLEAYASPTPTSVVTGARSLERHIWEAGGVAIGRVTGFEWLSGLTG